MERKPVSSQPTSKPSKCETCKHRFNFSRDCRDFEQKEEVRARLWIVLSCTGWEQAKEVAHEKTLA